MNKHIHRLVFDRQRGMRVPAGEHTRSAGKAAGGQSRAVALACAALLAGLGGLSGPTEADARTLSNVVQRTAQAWAGRTNPDSNLPVWSASRGDKVGWKFDSANTANYMRILQSDPRIIINWDSFNLGPGNTVEFVQPDKGAALNKIWDNKPSVILGNVKANGALIFESQNGSFIFGSGARVEAQRVVATALAVSNQAFLDDLWLRSSDDINVTGLSDYLSFDGTGLSPYYFDSNGNRLPRGVVVERGAEIKALAGGDVILVGPTVYNEGRIETPSGQTIMAAGQKVYLMSVKGEDQSQRGIMVAVDAFTPEQITQEDGSVLTVPLAEGVNVVEQAEAGSYTSGLETKINAVVAEKGSINLVGMAIWQNGVLSATTAVKGQNGVITLEASKTAAIANRTWVGGVNSDGSAKDGDSILRGVVPNELGSVEFGAKSETKVTPAASLSDPGAAPDPAQFTDQASYDKALAAYKLAKLAYDDSFQTDSDVYLRSRISVLGSNITLKSDAEGGAKIQAQAGLISLLAAESALIGSGTNFTLGGGIAPVDNSRITIEQGATLDASGLRDVALPMSRNQLDGRLFKSELADSPVQRDGVLYRQPVTVDARSAVKVANVRGFYANIKRDAQEWSTVGGNITIMGAGVVDVADGATLNVSGGSVAYSSGVVQSSSLRKGNRVVSLADANANERYDELITNPGSGQMVPGYVQGFDAGYLTLSAEGQLNAGLSGVRGDVVVGPLQRTGRASGDYTHERATSRALGRPKVLVDQNNEAQYPFNPQLYASLRPQPFGLSIGKTYSTGGDPIPFMSSLTISGKAGSGAGSVVNLSTLSTAPSQLNLAANDVVVDDSARIAMAATDLSVVAAAPSGLKIEAVNSIDFAGQVDGAGTTVSFKAQQGSITLAKGSVLDLSGDQVDEQRSPTSLSTITVNGGSFTASAGQSVLLNAGSLVDVSAGLWRDATGKLSKGTAGAVDLTLNTRSVGTEKPYDGVLRMAGTVNAFDFQAGGRLKIGGLRSLSITNESSNLAEGSGELLLNKAFFSEHGFGKFTLSSAGDVKLEDGVKLKPVLRNWVPQFRQARGATTASSSLLLASTLDEGVRSGVGISLSATADPAFSMLVPISGLTKAGNVKVGKDASIDVGAGGSISLSAKGSVDVAGDLTARGGKVTLAIDGYRGSSKEASASDDDVGYLADQAVYLRKGATIDVSGIAKTYKLPNGSVAGEILAGGSVRINPAKEEGDPVRRGRVVTEAGSSIKADGASGLLSFGSRGATMVSKGAGSIEVASADGILLQGAMSAARPDASVGAGRLLVSLTRQGVGDAVDTSTNSSIKRVPYSTAERELVLTATANDVAARAGDGVNKAVVSAEQLNDAGFDRIELKSEGSVVFAKGANLVAGTDKAPLRSVTLNAPVLRAEGGGDHTVRASYVALGNVNQPLPAGVNAPPSVEANTDGQASLNVQAGLIEVYGHTALQGLSTTTLDATLSANHVVGARRDGEVRLVGRSYGASASSSDQLLGRLDFDGNLMLRAGQIYATTLSQFEIKGRAARYNEAKEVTAKSGITVQAPQGGSSSQAPLSALAKLTMDAHDVTMQGVVRQPFGAIEIKAVAKPDLAAGSVLSVTGDGLSVPVGNMVGQTKWVYDISPSVQATLNAEGQTYEKGVKVTGDGIKIDSTATMQAQAGGDLLTWEFLAGVGGSTDTLARSNVFAILPNYSYDFAPQDTAIQSAQTTVGTTLTAGDQVVITSDNGVLAPGRYTLLPARYAVMPGAVLVSSGSNGTGATTTQAVQRDDGSVVVAGYLTAAGSSANQGNDTRLSFVLEPEATYRAKSDLSITTVSSLLKTQASKQGLASTYVPGDAGRIALISTGADFDWAAKYNLAGKDDLAAGEFNLSMKKMAVVADGAEAPKGFAAISATQLEETGARSIVLGGERKNGAIVAAAEQVQINADLGKAQEGGRTPSLGEVVAVASTKLTLADGVGIYSTQADDGRGNDIKLSGAGAALVVSNRASTSLTRDLAGAKAGEGATLTVGNNVALSGAAVQLDSSNVLSRSGTSTISAKTVGLGAYSMAVGSTDAKETAFKLDASDFNRQSLELRTYSGIDIHGSQTLGQVIDGTPVLQKLVLDTPMLRGKGLATDQVKIQAQQVTLRNSSGLAPDSAATGPSQLTVLALPAAKDATAEGITVGAGTQRLAFADATLKTSGDLVFRSTGQLQAQKNLTLEAARVTAGSGTKHDVTAGGVVTVKAYQGDTANDKGRTLNDTVGLGAQLTLNAARVVQKGHVVLNAGQLAIKGKGDGTAPTVEFAEGSTTSVAGVEVKQSGEVVAVAPGGNIEIVAEAGQVALRGTVDVSAPDASAVSQVGVAAGSLLVTATGSAETAGLLLGEQAVIDGSAGTAALSGRVTANVSHVLTETTTEDKTVSVSSGSLDRLAGVLSKGNVQREVDVRVTKDGVSLASSLNAGRVRITADGGTLTLNDKASIDATAAAQRGGVVQLQAKDDLILNSGSSIKATSSAAGANGGDVLLASSTGKVQALAGSEVVAGSLVNGKAQNGRVIVRAGISDKTTNGKTYDNVKATLTGTLQAAEVMVEGVRTYSYTGSDVSLNTALQGTYATAADTFVGNASKIKQDMGLAATSTVGVRYGVEVKTDKSVTVANDWNLYRANKTPINLTIRAAGDVNVNGTISDGFTSVNRYTSNTAPSTMVAGDAASIRIVAGADTASADVMRTSGKADTGNLTVAGGKMIRTTKGSIDLAANQDIILKEGTDNNKAVAQAVVYVAGRPADALSNETSTLTNRSAWQQFTQQGGRVELTAGRNIQASAPIQTFANWFLHTGRTASTVAWAASFDAFRQGVGSMGGGDVRVVADGNITNLTVVAPTSARTYKAADGSSQQQVDNGGDVLVRADGDLIGGMFFLGRGAGSVEVGGDITKGTGSGSGVTATPGLGLVLGLMDGQWRVQAQGDVVVGDTYNPTAVNPTNISVRDPVTNKNLTPKISANSVGSSHVTYSDAAAVSLISVGGKVIRTGDTQDLAALHASRDATPALERLAVTKGDAKSISAFLLAPSVYEVSALNGNVELETGFMLAPSARGNLQVYASEDVLLTQGGGGNAQRVLALLDVDTSKTGFAGLTSSPDRTGSVDWSSYITSTDGIHRTDTRKVSVVAGGDIDDDKVTLNLPKQANILAQGNITGLDVLVTHQNASDVTRIEAGGNFTGETNNSLLQRQSGLIQLNGPGELQVQAGRTLDLLDAGGILTTGDGATLRVAAGMAKQVDVDALASIFLADDAQAQAALVAYVEQTLKLDGLSYADALAHYRGMTREHQVDFAQKQLVLPAFAKQYVQDDSGKADVIWAWLARATGQSESDLTSATYQRYQAAQGLLVSYVEGKQKIEGLSFATALARYRQMSSADKAGFVDQNTNVSPEIVMAMLAAASSQPYAQAWSELAASRGVSVTDYSSPVFSRFMEDVLLTEIKRMGSVASAVADSANPLFNPRRAAVRDAIWTDVARMSTIAGMDAGFVFNGDLDLSRSMVHSMGAGSTSTGGMDLFVPGGQVLVGTATATDIDKKQAATRGIATYAGGSVRSYSSGDFQVASQKVHIVGSGDMMLYSSRANIDSGRGSNTAVTVPPKEAVDNGYGVYQWLAGKTTVGSGMAIFQNDVGVREGTISLLAPNGEVRALDAYIDAPSLDIAGPVLGADNLKGSVAGAPAAPAVSVNLSVNSGLGSETAAGQAQESMAAKQDKPRDRSSLLTVDILELGGADAPAAGEPKSDEPCKDKDGKPCAK